MKTLLLLIFTITFSYSQNIKINKNKDFYFEDLGTFDNSKMIWKEKGNFAIIKINYWKGDCCGSVPNADRITFKMIKNIIYYKLNIKLISNCDTSIGLCGNSVSFVINKNKYPNYKKIIFKEVKE